MQLLNDSPDVTVPGQMQAVMCVGSKYLVTSAQTLNTQTPLTEAPQAGTAKTLSLEDKKS